jgi:hypothetical protein
MECIRRMKLEEVKIVSILSPIYEVTNPIPYNLGAA